MAETTLNDNAAINVDSCTEVYPLFSRFDISEENKKSGGSQLLVPIGEYVCDALLMYNMLSADAAEVFPKNKQFSMEQIQKFVKRISYSDSPYVSVIGVCKFLGVPKEYWDKLILVSRKGRVRDIESSEKEKDFKENIMQIINEIEQPKQCTTYYDHNRSARCEYEEVDEDDKEESNENCHSTDYLDIFLMNCKTWSDDHLTMGSKQFKPLLTCQDKEPFPKPYQKPERQRVLESVEKQKEFIIIHCQVAKESMQEQLDEGIEYTDYGEAFVKSCDSQMETLSMIRYPDKSGTTNPDVNKIRFLLPKNIQESDLKMFLSTWERFDCELPSSGCAWDCMDEKLFTDTLDEIRDYFNKFIARESCLDTKLDSDYAWPTMETDVVRNDNATETQLALLTAREKIPNFWDLKRRKRIFLKHFAGTSYNCDWFDLYSESIDMFAHLVEERQGQFPTPFKDKYIKYFKDDKPHYDYYLWPQVPDHLQKKRRDKVMKYFIRTYHFKPDVQEFYSRWVERVKEAEKQFQAICDNFKPNPTPAQNPVAVFVPDSVFDDCDKPEHILKATNRTNEIILREKVRGRNETKEHISQGHPKQSKIVNSDQLTSKAKNKKANKLEGKPKGMSHLQWEKSKNSIVESSKILKVKSSNVSQIEKNFNNSKKKVAETQVSRSSQIENTQIIAKEPEKKKESKLCNIL